MIIKRDQNYKLYFLLYMFACVSVLLIYVLGLDVSIIFALLINSPAFVITILGLISTGRTFIMDENGCSVYFWKYYKKYTWEELKTKKIEEYAHPSMLKGRLTCPYTKEAFAAPYKIRKPKTIRSNLYSLFHPFSFIYVNFSLENEDWKTGRYYEVEEVIFRQK